MSGDYQGIKIRLHEPGGFTEHLPDDLLPFLADCLEQVTEITDLAREDETVIWGPDEQLKIIFGQGRDGDQRRWGKMEIQVRELPCPVVENISRALHPYVGS